MVRRTSAVKIFDSATVASSGTLTSDAVDIQTGEAFSLHVTAITGTTPLVAFTYSIAPTLNGPFTIPQSPYSLGGNKSAADVIAFTPEAGGAMKIIATNNGTGAVVVTAYAVVIEAA